MGSKYWDQERTHGEITLGKKNKTQKKERADHEDTWENGILAERTVSTKDWGRRMPVIFVKWQGSQGGGNDERVK